ncbi:putative component of type VI protein secretion system [Bradyrhizobium elkanii]
MIDYWVMVRDDIAARARCGAAPAPGPLPAGTDIREAAEFKWIEAEVRRMDANGPAAVDWSNVSTLSLNILAKQSKDILVACWATYGLFRVDGYEGLAVGLGVLCGMVEMHWEGLFPPLKQEGARVEALDWLISRLRPAVAGIVPTPADSLAVVAAYDSLDDLAHQLSGKLASRQLALEGIRRALQSHYEQATCELATASEHAAEAVSAAE